VCLPSNGDHTCQDYLSLASFAAADVFRCQSRPGARAYLAVNATRLFVLDVVASLKGIVKV
jgi:hypothetical protein